VQGGDLVDHPFILPPGKNIAGSLLDNVLVAARGPHRLDDQFSAVGPAFGGDNPLLVNGPIFSAIRGLDGVGIVPE